MTEPPSLPERAGAARHELAALRAEVAQLRQALHEAGQRAASDGEAAALPDAAALAAKESETKYSALFNAVDEGFCIVEVLFDAAGRAEDYRFLEVNTAFERQTGLRHAVGQRMRELAPAHEEHWFETYGQVASTGKPVHFVHYAASLGARWYDVRAFRIDRPEQHRVGILFDDVTEARHAQARPQENEERLRTTLSMRTVGVLFWDENFRLTETNEAFLRMMGGEPADVLGRTWQELTPLEFHPASEHAVSELRTRGEATPYEKQYFRHDGSRFWGLFAVRTLGRGAVEFVLDVSDRKETEAALRASEERLRQFGEASQDVLWIRDAETLQWLHLTPAFETIYGLRREEALSGDNYTSWLNLIVPEDRERVTAEISRVRAGEQVAFEYRIRRPADGAVRWLRDTDFPMRDPGGAVERIGGVGQDVTELKRIDAALREGEARQRALVEGIPQLVWRSDESGRWTWSSPQWRAFTGQSQEASRNWGWLDALHPADREAARAAWREVGADGVLQLDCRIRHGGSGHHCWFQVRGVPVRSNGRVVEWIGSCTDIDDQMRARDVLRRTGEELEARVAERTAKLMAAEESLRQTQKMEAVGQLTGGIAHDFNNMLQGVAGGLSMARRRIDQGQVEGATRYLDIAHGAVERAAGLTRRLLAFARRQRLEPRPVDADGLVVGLVDLVRRTVGPGIAVELTLHDGAGSVVCDANELESALLNLCINARDAMPEGGQLAIRTKTLHLSDADIRDAEVTAGLYVEIVVTDTGTGMPPDTLARVFEPFFTTKPQGQGTGLGLSQVYGFVRQSGGLVRMESTPGQGTRVRLFLPLHEDVAASINEPMPPASAPGGLNGTVLLVDDEDAVRQPAADRLRELGATVLEARNGPEALRVLASSARPDLLVTDVGLPGGMNGRQVAEAVLERVPGVPVLFVTGYAGTVLPPGMEVIGKPFELDAFLQRVQVVLKDRRQDSDRTL